ncbi:gene transfer agent family protein [Pleomorphomonas koreensis]|uniref:gene transfer agent family protein n=1 Tax=Pleomorphomonas koreensis TaxID=257440 RepID=UPI00047896CC|nr:gene transfer agent family protein [Pleomorphomonas koreensis]
MSRNASISLDFGDGEHEFRFAIGQLRELEEKTGVSSFRVLARMLAYEPMADDRREVIRLGLIGGGMKPSEALHLVRTYCDERPPAETLPTAVAILQAGLMGVPDEEPGKSQGETTAPTAPPTTD